MKNIQWAYMARDWRDGVEEVEILIWPGWHTGEARNEYRVHVFRDASSSLTGPLGVHLKAVIISSYKKRKASELRDKVKKKLSFGT